MLALPNVARADTPSDEPTPSPAGQVGQAPSTHSLAESLETRGAEAYDAGNFREALRLFTESYGAEARAAVLLRVAITEYKLQRYPDAIRHARKYAESADANASEARSMLTRFIPRCRALTAHVRFDGVARDAELELDHDPPAKLTEEIVELMPGAHRVAIHQAGRTFAFNVELAANESRTLSLNEEHEERAIPAPSLLAPVRPETTNASSSPSRARWWTVTGLGVASLGSFIAGTVFYVKSENAYARGKDLHASLPSNSACIAPSSAELATTCADLRQAYTSDYPHNRDRGLGFVIAGGALAVGALATWFLWPKRSSATSTTAVRWLAPDVQMHAASLHLGGTF